MNPVLVFPDKSLPVFLGQRVEPAPARRSHSSPRFPPLRAGPAFDQDCAEGIGVARVMRRAACSYCEGRAGERCGFGRVTRPTLG